MVDIYGGMGRPALLFHDLNPSLFSRFASSPG
jgi:hypothetical protein